MKPYLLYEQDADKSFEDSLKRKIPNENELVQDLNLHHVFQAMAQNDPFLYSTAKRVVLNSLMDIPAILYRQSILKDCINNGPAIRELFTLAASAVKEAAYYKEYTQPNFSKIIPVSVRVFNSAGLLELLVVKLEDLKSAVCGAEKAFHSKGLTEFSSRLAAFTTDEFFIKVKEYIADLKYINEGGRILLGSCIGNGMKSAGHILRGIAKNPPASHSKKAGQKPNETNGILLDNIRLVNAAKEMEDAGLIHILRAVNQFTGSIVSFFDALRHEMGFYLGCVNLYNALLDFDAPLSFPIPEAAGKITLSFSGLYDISLALNQGKKPVSNDLDAAGRTLFIITGANQGGKSTFLRSIGLAQLLMQCGSFVPAAFYCSSVCDGIFTHFTREEDVGMNSGKLDEELFRISNIVDLITSNSMLLLNEPFATTTERDGSRIAEDIIAAFHEWDIRVLFVTHLFEFSSRLYKKSLEKAVFLRAERNDDGSRPFCIRPGEPLQTSYGKDLFDEIML